MIEEINDREHFEYLKKTNKVEEMNYDIIIIGGGPAGLTSGIYASRGRLKTLLIEKQLTGGLPATTDLIENYPGFPDGINGMGLMNDMKKQAQRFGTEIHEFEEVKNIIQAEKGIKIKTNKQEYMAFSVIIATGSVPKTLNVTGENEFRGKGVSYCATCDGPLFRDKEVAVVGCGNSGIQEGEALLKFVRRLTFIEFLPYMTAEKILQDRIRTNENVSFFLNHAVTSIKGNNMVDSIIIMDRDTEKDKELQVSGVFIYAGFLPNSGFLKGVLKLDEEGYIITNEKMETSVTGIFATGDIRADQIRQVSTACGNAVTAVINAEKYIKGLKNKFGSLD
ncbi:thioredoxin-disulfide reductase [bacterium]|nr:thioredoxin-disulfide reductase [bacterium]